VLEPAMQKWRAKVEHVSASIVFGDGLQPLLDLRFADAVVLFARLADECVFLMKARG